MQTRKAIKSSCINTIGEIVSSRIIFHTLKNYKEKSQSHSSKKGVNSFAKIAASKGLMSSGNRKSRNDKQKSIK